MVWKNTMIFRATSGGPQNAGTRAGSWTESYFSTSRRHPINDGPTNLLLQRRRQLLPDNCSIIGMRVADAEKLQGSQVYRFNLKGLITDNADIPQMAVRCNGSVTQGNVVEVDLRGTPDSWVISGELTQNVGIRAYYYQYLNALSGFSTIVRNLASTAADVVGVSALGVVQTATPFLVIADDPTLNKVQLLRTRGLDRINPNGFYTVTSVADDTHFTVANWPAVVRTGGTVRYRQTVYVQYPDDMQIVEVHTRRIGGVLFGYRGRRSAVARR